LASEYLDDLSIYSNSEKEHVGHVESVMQPLLEAGLYSKPDTCQFHKETVRYLGLIISTKGISVDEDMVDTGRNCSREKKTKNGWLYNVFEVQHILVFCNYYRQFISKYSEEPEQFTRSMKKDEPFLWELEQQLAFETMISAFTRAPALSHFDHEREAIIETDGSD